MIAAKLALMLASTDALAGFIVGLVGRAGSGKSTVAVELEGTLHQMGIVSYRLDGDNIRHGLNKDLGFSPGERSENIRRIGEMAKLFVDAGIITLTAFISPFRADRDRMMWFVKTHVHTEQFSKNQMAEFLTMMLEEYSQLGVNMTDPDSKGWGNLLELSEAV